MILKEKLYPDAPRFTEAMLATDTVTLVKRMLLSITVPLPFMSLFFIASWSMENVFLLMAIKTLIPTLATMFIMFLISDRLFIKYGLLKLEDGSSKSNASEGGPKQAKPKN